MRCLFFQAGKIDTIFSPLFILHVSKREKTKHKERSRIWSTHCRRDYINNNFFRSSNINAYMWIKQRTLLFGFRVLLNWLFCSQLDNKWQSYTLNIHWTNAHAISNFKKKQTESGKLTEYKNNFIFVSFSATIKQKCVQSTLWIIVNTDLLLIKIVCLFSLATVIIVQNQNNRRNIFFLENFCLS